MLKKASLLSSPPPRNVEVDTSTCVGIACARNQPVSVLVEDGGILLLGGDDADLAGELESALDDVVGDDIELLLLLSLRGVV
jgi:hypothetical protein